MTQQAAESVLAPTAELQTPPAPTKVKDRPKLPEDLLAIARDMRADAPDQPILYGWCGGPEEEHHEQTFELGFSAPGVCMSCGLPIAEMVPVFRNGENGGK